MLQPTIFQPQQAPITLLAVESTNPPTAASPARMSASRLCPDASTNPSSALLPQKVEHIQSYFPATEFVRHQSGMNVNTGAHSKRSYIEKSSGGESAGDVEWEGAPRGSKRREIRVERESRSDRIYTEADQHHHRQSGGSDLTTEQSAVCMAADDQSTTTRSTSSLNEDGCLLKLHSAVPPISGHGDLSPDVDEDDHSSKLVFCDAAAVCANSYNAHGSFSHLPTPFGGERWLVPASHHAAAKYKHHIEHDLRNANEQQDEEVEADWLKLSLGRNTVRDDVMHMSRSSSPCTLQLLPEQPDCAVMKEREKRMKELKLCNEDHYERMIRTTSATFEQAHQQLGNMRENDPHCYTNLMQTSCLPLPPADCTIGQYITSQGLLPIHYNVDRSSNPTISALDHPSAAVHMQQQLVQGDNISQISAASLHALQGQCSFRSMVCSSLREGPVGSCPVPTRSSLPDFSQQNWDLLESSSSQSPSCSMLQPPATSFRDLIASSIVQEPLENLNYGHMSLLPAIPKQQIFNGDPLNHQMMWPCSKMQHNQSSSFVNRTNDVAMAIDRVNTSTGFGSKSMSDWLSQALSATKFDPVNQRPGDGDPDHDCTNLTPGRQKVIYGSTSKHQPPLKLITGGHSAAARGTPGFWFGLQPSNRQPEDVGDEGEAEDNVQFKTSYVRLKDGNVPLSVVRKFLITKLGLSQESQMAFACRGKVLEESSFLKRVQDDIWLPLDFVQIENRNFKSVDSYNLPKDNVMILTYQILK